MRTSTIGWCDFSGGDLNFVTGCTPVSEGCANCYARAIYQRFGRDFSRVTWHEDKLRRLAHTWFPRDGNKRGPNKRPICFVCDTGDLFHDSISSSDIMRAFEVMEDGDEVTWAVLTKRPERMRRMVKRWGPLPQTVWLGVSVENQARADERIPILLDTPAAVRFVSVEPMLGPVFLGSDDYSWLSCTSKTAHEEDEDVDEIECCELFAMGGEHYHGIDWVICGGESGPRRRLFEVRWALDLYRQCKEAGIPFFYKQGSALRPGQDDELPGIGQVKEWPR